MLRNIIGQFIFQVTVLIVILFNGKSLFNYTYNDTVPFFIINPLTGETIATQKTEHYTFLFNTFVFMLIFNIVNSRKIKEINVFNGFFKSFLSLGILLGTAIVQILLVQFGGQTFRTVALTLNKHMLSIGIGLFSLILGGIIKILLRI